MDIQIRRRLLRGYRRERELTNTNPVGEATGRTYIPIPAELRAAGAQAEGVPGFVRLFEQMLDHSPVVVRRGELLAGDYYFLLPYEIIPLEPPLDGEAFARRGALPVSPSGHTVVNLSRGLALGWQGLADHVAACRARFADGTPEAEYLDGSARVVELIRARIRAYASEAMRSALAAPDADEAAELRSLSARCSRLADDPPATFHEALQWYFFFVTFERATSSGMGSVRLDQVLYPYYRRDREAGLLDDTQAQLLVECLLLKEVLFCSVGGVTPAGDDATNELSHLILTAYDAIGGPANIAVRWHAGIDPRLTARAVDLLTCHGTGVPSMVNDEVIIPSLLHFGFPLEQARNYCFAGCFWYVVPGKEYTCHDLTAVSGVRALRRALDVVSASGTATYEDLWQAYCRYLLDAVAALVEAYDIIDPWLAGHYPEMVISLLMDGCLERGRDANNSGADYSLMTVLYIGLANVVDSLYALKLRVFEQKLTTLREVSHALDHDFVGHERLRRLLRSAPKYGNGHAGVDAIAVQVAEQFKAALCQCRNSKGFRLRPAFYSWHRHTFEGSQLGATPDGRRAGVPLAHGGNPAHGCAREGVTAAIRSMTRINYDDTAGCPLHIHLHEGDEQARRKTIASLLQASFRMGAPHLILNVVNGHDLREAINHPEHYADLTIRITGYSARFVQLERKYQEEIAARNAYNG
jgi:pyruvate-formate lyase